MRWQKRGLLLEPPTHLPWVASHAAVPHVDVTDHEARVYFTTRDADRRSLDQYLDEVKSDTSELNITLLTTLQCNFACAYCFQGDHGDYNKRADKMSLDTARQNEQTGSRATLARGGLRQ